MKLSCLPVSLYPELSAGTRSLADWFRFAADLGLDGADVSVVHLASTETAYLHTLREQATDAGVQIAMLVTYADFTHPDSVERARQVDLLRRYIGVAALLETPYIRVTAGQAHPGLEREAATEWAVTRLVSSVVDEPYDALVPYSTWLSAASSVVQVMVAPLLVRLPDCTALTTGAVASGSGGVVVKTTSTQ